MELFDTHCHLNDPQFAGRLQQILSDANQQGVHRMIAVGCDLESSQECVALAEQFAELGVFASVGIQPNYAHQAKDGDWEAILDLMDHPRVVAIGETGLDQYWDDCPIETQREFFELHCQASRDRSLPVIIHMRDCEDEMLRFVESQGKLGGFDGVMHSFTGSLDGMLRFLAHGLYISFAGMVTYKKSDALRKIATKVPTDRILIETDAPYLSPEPHRKIRPNEPRLVYHTAVSIAEQRNTPLDEFCRQTTSNALHLFQKVV